MHTDHTLSRQLDQVITSLERTRDPLLVRWLRWIKATLEIGVPPCFGQEGGRRW